MTSRCRCNPALDFPSASINSEIQAIQGKPVYWSLQLCFLVSDLSLTAAFSYYSVKSVLCLYLVSTETALYFTAKDRQREKILLQYTAIKTSWVSARKVVKSAQPCLTC